MPVTPPTITLDEDVRLELERQQTDWGTESVNAVLREQLDLDPDPAVRTVLSHLDDTLRPSALITITGLDELKFTRDVDEEARSVRYRDPDSGQVMVEVRAAGDEFEVSALDDGGNLAEVGGGRASGESAEYWTVEEDDPEAFDVVVESVEAGKRAYRTWLFQDPWLSGCGVAKWKGLKIGEPTV